MKKSTAIVLVNLGTPDGPDEDSIRRYLKQFLSDPRVVDWPRWLWLPILNQIILRTRPAKLVEKYKMIWGTKDGPIRNITHALTNRLQHLMPDVPVHFAMTYGRPSVSETLDQLADVEHILVVPLFPQAAGATTGSVRDAFDRARASRGGQWQVSWINDYCAHPGYIKAIGDSVRRAKSYRNGKPRLVFSFHGIPQSQSRAGDSYADQCQETASLVAANLNLPTDRWMVTYQSRFGPLPWLQPYTDKTLAALPEQGIKDVLVVCPGFSVDCLETIEEIRVLNRDIFLAAGGEGFAYVKALNASWGHADVLKQVVGPKLTD
ncbi:MAG: ferrochelatase [Gammaproteobacteria bacterium]|jgi:protoporphyrin/coproporphyrin ferrochelatase|nr:ferrochelatase [Gammaproteobacteria bacterium]MBT7371392.1 ferrochelatase [Gammaproteobacteria bacterium]